MVDSICLGVHRGERFGLLGPNGAGNGLVQPFCFEQQAHALRCGVMHKIRCTFLGLLVSQKAMTCSDCASGVLLDTSNRGLSLPCHPQSIGLCRQDNHSGDAGGTHTADIWRCPGGRAEHTQQRCRRPHSPGILPPAGPAVGPPDWPGAPGSLRQAQGCTVICCRGPCGWQPVLIASGWCGQCCHCEVLWAQTGHCPAQIQS